MRGTDMQGGMMLNRLSARIRRALPRTIARRLPKKINVVLVSERHALRLNRRYRGRRTPASVLSFRYGPEYGEILVCPAVITREAARFRHSFDYQMTWMVLHGMLHGAGVHHEKSPRQERRVERLEAHILERLAGKNSKFKV